MSRKKYSILYAMNIKSLRTLATDIAEVLDSNEDLQGML
jgi:hypothetical protein